MAGIYAWIECRDLLVVLVKSPEDGDLMFVVFNDGDDGDDDDALQRHLPIYRYLYKSGTRSIGRIFGTWSLKLRSTAPNKTLYGIQTSVGLSPTLQVELCSLCHQDIKWTVFVILPLSRDTLQACYT